MRICRTLSLLTALFVAILTAAPLSADPATHCGDITGDGKFDLSDPINILVHLYDGYPPLHTHSNGDIDTSVFVTGNDMIMMFDGIFRTWPPPSYHCPGSRGPLRPPVDSALRVIYGDTVSAFATQAVVPITLSFQRNTNWNILPIAITLEGVAPQIDSVVFDPTFLATINPLDIKIINPFTDRVTLITFHFYTAGLPPGDVPYANIYLTVPPADSLRLLDVELTRSPAPNGLPNDTTVFPIVSLNDFPAHTPLTPLFIPDYLCGDVNHDYKIDANDVVALVEFYFGCGPEPFPAGASDVNCDGEINVDDLLTINAIAAGGNPTLCCPNSLPGPEIDIPEIPELTPRQDSLRVELRALLSDIGL